MKKRGISLLVLIITIIVVAILASAVIIAIFNTNTIDQSKKARFMSDFRTVQEGVNLFSYSRYNAETNEFGLPLKGYLVEEDKEYITNNVSTLKTKIEELSGTISDVNLAWINSEDIGIKLSKEKTEKGYIIDVSNGQIYDYVGDVFEGKRWHTLDGGVTIGEADGNGPGGTGLDEELWSGWIRLTLYYPPNSTEKQWRLGTEGELRVDPILMWQNYTGPIIIPLDRVKDVWIKYKLDNKEVVVPPAGTLLVDIVPDKTGYTKVPGVKVHINFDSTATIKEYRVGSSDWMPYTGEFSVTENCIIEARARKTETIYNTDGSVLTTRNIAGRDLVYIGNIGIEETQLEAPSITRLPPIGTEKARVAVTYPVNADKKVYKINYGIEENYETEINVDNYGTYIIAYYYDSNNKRSKAAAIRINDTTKGALPEYPVEYIPYPPYEPGNRPPQYDPGDYGINIPAPTINISPTSIAEEVQVSVNAPANADKIYIKLGRYGDYKLYDSPIIVRENMDIYSYYRTYMGERSDTGYGRVSNIKKNNRPYVRIDADPYPYSWNYGAEEVSISIVYTDTEKIEYSEDGIVYMPYTNPFKVTENKTIYARGTNSYGVTETSINITNIGRIKAPKPIGNLSVGINVNPEPMLSTTRFAKATVSIDYDSKATEKYYRIGRFGELKTYTGPFEVTSNTTIYAIAKGENAKGSTSKKIDNLSDGIAEPIITAEPSGKQQSSKVIVTIEYDKYSKIKRYSIDGGSLRDYSSPFEITKNGTVIYAYSENDVGQKSETTYTINNIVPEPPVLLLDKGKYYILKLNYPEGSKNREYKWKEDGIWTGYKEAGILLLKPQYKDELMQNVTLIKVEDENGNLVTFTGDYYFIDVPISELFENISMRWDREPLGAPQIVITPVEPSMQVTANIVYNTNLIKKQYKVVNPDGSIKTDWTDYTGPISIDRNNTLIYAKGMDDSEVWTAESIKKVTNIDENPPVLKLSADLDTAMQKVAIKVIVTDDVGVGKIKWAAGILGESYFVASGTEIANNSVVNITENGYYTFYAEDQVGNKQVYTLNVTNVDLTPPAIGIQVNPENTVGLYANITIDYGDAITKQYKIGTSNSVWSNYTNVFEISSYTVLSNNWQNDDGTVTIYAKGKDSSGNETIVQKKVVNLDLDKPKEPIITSNSGYPILTNYGINLDALTSISYDARTDIDNYFSIDNGTTWEKYTGTFDFVTGTIIAKSVKRGTGLEVVVTKTIAMPSDAIGISAYDGNDSSYYETWNKTIKYMLIDSSMQGQKVRLYIYTAGTNNSLSGYDYVKFYDAEGTEVGSIPIYLWKTTYNNIVTVPDTAVRLGIYAYSSQCYIRLHEIAPSNEPTFTATNGYALLHANPTKTIRQPYQMVSINYTSTSTQRLYSTDNITWKNYEDTPILVNQGTTLYAKGLDMYGTETRVISSYTANVPDSLKGEAFDLNEATFSYLYAPNKIGVVLFDQSMYGKKIRVHTYSVNHYGNGGYYVYANFVDINGNVLSTVNLGSRNQTYNKEITVPQNTYKMYFTNTGNNQSVNVYEIEVMNEPTFTARNGYMLLHADPAKSINIPYQMVSIDYFPTSVQRLYSLDGGVSWLNYLDKEIWLNQGDIIHAKGIDQYGNETRIISSYTSSIPDAISTPAYDGNDATYYETWNTTKKYMSIDSSMQGKEARIYIYTAGTNNSLSGYDYVKFYDAAGTEVGSIPIYLWKTTYNKIVTIPNTAVKLGIYAYSSQCYIRLYEITPQ